MEIPKMKILIYVLTFAGYAWSGYGNNIFSNLKDAVISAEKVFGDFLVHAVDVAKKLKAVHDAIDLSVEEECKWSCPDGKHLITSFIKTSIIIITHLLCIFTVIHFLKTKIKSH